MTARTNTRGGEAGRAATTPPGLPFVPATVAAASALVLLALATVSACSRGPAPPPPPRLLVLGDAGAGEVPSGARRALAAVAGELGIGLEDADASALDEESLAACAAVVLLRAEPSFLESDADERALRRFVESGGGFVGLRAALEAAADRPWFTRLVGARRGEDGGLERRSPRVETSVADGAEAWRQSYDGGRSFVVDLGPDAAAWADPAERARLAEGVAWVVAGGPRRADRVLPDDETFEVETLVDGLEDPIELAVDEGGNVFVLERTGALKRYDAGDRRIETVRRFEVASKTEEGGHAQECGGLGLALDPAFARNGFVYVYRSPPEPSVNRLSRFTFDGERLVDERVLLDVATDREHTTCHEGGSLAFGPDGCLFLSTGDNTNPFESDGFAPLDEREDRRWWDAQRSAGNSNDLRGSILRVRPLPDGTLAIPDGNLWPPGTERTRPEIYVKGCRNPYRIAVDPRTGAVWWGDVGPDADVDAGGNPMGADELNRAERAGFHGWPYAIGRRAYGDRSFRTGASGASFAEGIVNDSPHSDGLAALPAPVAPFLAYPYREADDLPELGDGGRNAMAGPILHHDEGKVGGFPPWFDRVMVFYDWSRAGLWLLKIDDRGRLETLLPWLVDETWKHPIDLERGPDGALYLLEYGSTWWDNRDGRLRRISFGGFDRRPRAVVTPSATDGAVPLSILFDATSTVDPEAAERHGDPTRGVRFRWAFGDGATSSESAPTHVYRRAGAYDVELVVTDAAGRTDVWSGRVVAGNTAPAVAVSTSAEEGVFAWGSAIDVAVDVHDPDEETFDPRRLTVTAEYLEDGPPDDAAAPVPLVPGFDPRHLGTRLLAENGCASCHHPTLASSGPSFGAIAERYADAWTSAEAATRAQLVDKVRRGGFGVWGNVPMSGHMHVPVPSIENMVDAIFEAAPPPPVPVEAGRLEIPARPADWRDAFGVWRIRAAYGDLPPAPLLPSLTTTVEVDLEAPPAVWALSDVAGEATAVPGPSARIDGEDAVRGEGAVEWWSDEATALVWTVRVARRGTFRVAVEWGSPDHEAGSAWALEVAGRTFEGTTPATGGRDRFVAVEAGVVELDRGTHEVTLRPTRIAERFAGDVRGLVLTREE